MLNITKGTNNIAAVAAYYDRPLAAYFISIPLMYAILSYDLSGIQKLLL